MNVHRGGITGLLRRFPDSEKRQGRSAVVAAWRITKSLVLLRYRRSSMTIVDIGGALVHADLSTPLGLGLYRYGCRTIETRVLVRLLRRNDVFIDGGANIGTFSLLAATVVGSRGRVIACEPSPQTMSLLKANTGLNGFDVIECHQVALSDQIGTAGFVVFDDAPGLASFAPALHGGKLIEVPTTTLDDLCARVSAPVAVIKLDIEGAEVRALQGARSMLARDLPLVLLEVEPGHLSRQGSSVKDLRQALQPLGYEAYAIRADARLTRIAGPWQPAAGASPNLVLAPVARADRVERLRTPPWCDASARAVL